ncbi:FecR domain-containing protein [Litoribrevibacter euphylliae]|uniref:FecR domain-containing protein n=1 Tax=Litoribrevibacter euphylliae TaxID=1834034 RepID=A0ABV7HE90_9GAMM
MYKSLLGLSVLCSALIGLSLPASASSSTPNSSDISNADKAFMEMSESAPAPATELINNPQETNQGTSQQSLEKASSETAAPMPHLVVAENLMVGSIRELTGKAVLHKQGEVRGESASSGDILKAQDILRTKRNSQAVVQLIDGSTIVLQEQTSLHLKGLQSLSLEEGTVLFDIRKRGKSKGLQVATKTAVIGVKGTQFLVKDEDNQVDVYLNEGNVEINPIEGSFKHYKAVSTESFNDYSQQMMEEFQKEKEKMHQGIEDMKREFVEYLNSFDMKAGTAVSISGDELTSYPMPDHYNDLFKELEQQAEITRQKLNQQQ